MSDHTKGLGKLTEGVNKNASYKWLKLRRDGCVTGW